MSDGDVTDEQRRRLEDWIRQNCGPHQYGEQDENGVDLSLIRANLRLTPEERLRRGDQATTDMINLRKHARRIEPGAA